MKKLGCRKGKSPILEIFRRHGGNIWQTTLRRIGIYRVFPKEEVNFIINRTFKVLQNVEISEKKARKKNV